MCRNKMKHTYSKGLTLIELLIGLTLSVSIFLIATSLMVNILGSNLKSKQAQTLEQVKNDFQAETSNSVRWANSLSFVNGVFEVDGDKYYLNYDDGRIYKNDIPITPSDVEVDSFDVARYSTPVEVQDLGAGTGLFAEYYDNPDFTELKFTQVDFNVDFDWQTDSPKADIYPDTFSTRWVGQVEAPVNGNYTFYVSSDDGSRLWVDNKLVVDNWGDHGRDERSGNIQLKKDFKYDLRLDYYENGGYANVSLSWAQPGQLKEIIPSTSLYPELGASNLEVKIDLSNRADTSQKESLKFVLSPRGGAIGAIEDAPVDVCPNLDGFQVSVPEGYHMAGGVCKESPPPVDQCPNIEGMQASVPSGKMKDDSGNCVDAPPEDLCDNIEGIQEVVPSGYMKSGGDCVVAVDVCPNIPGTQTSVPGGQEVDEYGNCIGVDVCPNLDGRQTSVPDGYILEKGKCVEPPNPTR